MPRRGRREELREYLVLAKLAPVVREQILGMTTMTANELVTEEKLRFIARERNHVGQRRMFERLLAGQLRCTRTSARPERLAEAACQMSHAAIAAPQANPVPASAQQDARNEAMALG